MWFSISTPTEEMESEMSKGAKFKKGDVYVHRNGERYEVLSVRWVGHQSALEIAYTPPKEVQRIEKHTQPTILPMNTRSFSRAIQQKNLKQGNKR